MSSSRTLLRKLRTSFTCIKPRFDPSIILLYIAASVEQYCDITQLNALPENEGILEGGGAISGLGTIHMVRWVIFDNETRLLFATNFDGDVEDYMRDFALKAPQGI